MVNPNFINGEWVSAKAASQNINPSDTDNVIGEYAEAGVQEAEDAIAAAHAAFPGWRNASSELRADILDKAGSEILARRDELGNLLASEEGKTLVEATGEVVRAARILKFFAGEAIRLGGERLASVRQGIEVDILREPEGVFGIITPWNFPIAIPAWKIAPALAYGNTVVFKPAEIVPASAWMLVDILSRAGLPDGVLNLVMGKGSVIGDAIVNSRHVRGVSFTGSVPTGRRVGMSCMEHNKKVQLEMGGKNPLVIADDADLEVAVSVALNGSYFSTGQRCTASSRLIVMSQIHDRFVSRLAERLKETRVGHALDPNTQIGPVVSKSQLEQDVRYIEIAKSEGAELAFGGRELSRETKGYYLEPALFTNTTNSMRINREEVFGPVASVIKVADYDEAVAIANDTDFGLASGICTTSLKLSSDFKKRSAAGMVMINVPTAGVDYHVPFGGRKASSYGPREQGTYAREFYTSVKTAYTSY